LAEFSFALMLMESSLAIEKAFDNERSTKSFTAIGSGTVVQIQKST
jgi:hypothetical protein